LNRALTFLQNNTRGGNGFIYSAFYWWKIKFIGAGAVSLRRPKKLEEERQYLKQMYATINSKSKDLYADYFHLPGSVPFNNNSISDPLSRTKFCYFSEGRLGSLREK